jgi:hypothetical protein
LITRDTAVQAVEGCNEIIKEWEAWQPTENEKHRYDNMMVKPLGDEPVQALSVLTEMFFTTDVAQDAWQIALAVDRVRDELRRWLSDRSAVGDGRQMPALIDPRGSAEMWRAYREVLTIAFARRRSPPPSAKIQRDQGANPSSIAKMLGWWRAPGEPDIERVMAELAAKPEDEEYDPTTWVHPRELQRHKELESEWTARCERLQSEITISKAPRRRREAAKESVEELAHLRGMTVRQIAILKNMTEQQVQVELAHLGMYLDASGLHDHRSTQEEKDDEAEILRECDPHDECGPDLDARIIAMHQDGTRAKYIYKKLSHHLAKTVSPQKVARVIKTHEQQSKLEAVPSVA